MARLDRRLTNSRDEILDAAERVAAQEGFARLTLDAVARESGLSKGGVLYNFPGKDALLRGMVDRMVETFRPAIEAERAALGSVPNATLRAIVSTHARKDEADPRVMLAILAAAASDAELLAPVREAQEQHFGDIESETRDPDLALVLWAAVHGLMLQRLLGIAPYSSERRKLLLQRLLTHIEEVER